MRGQRGQVAAEYLGVLLVVAAIVAAVAGGGLPGRLASGLARDVCRIAGTGTCAAGPGAPALTSSTADSDHDGLPDSEDPVPGAGDFDHDGLTDGEEIALGSDPRNPDSDGDTVPDGDEYRQGTDPTKAVLPLTKENALKPWERVGMTEDEWNDLQEKILDAVNPHGWKAWLGVGGPEYAMVTLDEHGRLELVPIVEDGIPVGQLLRAIGVGGKLLDAGAAMTKALSELPATSRAALIARGVLPAAARAIGRVPIPPQTPGVVLGELDDLGRASGASATITREMLDTGTDAAQSIRPPGFGGQAAGQARGHLIARMLGGTGRDARNLVTLYQNPVNSPIMRDFEQQIYNAVESGQTVKYTVEPIYRGTEAIPRAVTLRATGSGGFNLHVTILNAKP
jgi:DNA/RNA non-specific endonuclease/Bacterial TSP3 repeat